MKIGLVYHNPDLPSNVNIGDDIQTLGVINFLHQIYGDGVEIIYIDREKIHLFKSEKPILVLMQGWWMHNPRNWPPSEFVIPLFIGFHLNISFKRYLDENTILLDYFKKYSPIGCRDLSTYNFFRERSVDAYFTGCMSIFQKPDLFQKKSDLIFLVDCNEVIPLLPRTLAQGDIVSLSHRIGMPLFEERIDTAQKLINLYSNRGKMVITSRLHCALPCLSLGIPVIVFLKHRNDSRLALLKEYTSNIHFFGYFYYFLQFTFFVKIYLFIYDMKKIWRLAPLNNLKEKKQQIELFFSAQIKKYQYNKFI